MPVPSVEGSAHPSGLLLEVLEEARRRVIDEIRCRVPASRRDTGDLYRLMLDYPLRPAKALRPALCIAACRIFGGSLDQALPSAAALELYHNAFLIHDDVEDRSELRRGAPTLHRLHGVPVAINVGDGMLALAMAPLLDNVRHLGLIRALRILDVVGEMARESAEGQAMELAWIRDGSFDLVDRDYVRMVYKKSTHYSFVTPLTVGALAAGAGDRARRGLQRFGALLGIAFQIQDDLLNLADVTGRSGKEAQGDLWEGKRTLILLHAFRSARADVRAVAEEMLRRPREERTAADVGFLWGIIEASGSVGYARDQALRHCLRARRTLAGLGLPPGRDRDFFSALVDFVVERDR